MALLLSTIRKVGSQCVIVWIMDEALLSVCVSGGFMKKQLLSSVLVSNLVSNDGLGLLVLDFQQDECLQENVQNECSYIYT